MIELHKNNTVIQYVKTAWSKTIEYMYEKKNTKIIYTLPKCSKSVVEYYSNMNKLKHSFS